MFTFLDAARLLIAVATCGLVVALPGVALARAFGLARGRAIVVGLAVLPLVDSLAARLVGLDAALALTLGLATIGSILLVRARPRDGLPRISWQALALCLAWFAVVVFEWVDFDVAGRLYQPYTVIDAVKHAATTQAIVDGGAPPHDPFFLRPQRVSYYYFFYTLTALAERLGFGLVDARAAVGGAIFWVGLGLYGLVRLALERAGLAATGSRLLVIAILAAGGLDSLAVVRMGLLQGMWIAEPVSWNEQVTGLFESLLWVPHHVTGLIASMLGLMALAAILPRATGKGNRRRRWRGLPLLRPRSIDLVPTDNLQSDGCPIHHPSDGPPPPFHGGGCERPDSRDRACGIMLAAVCFASAFGLSVWLTLALVATVALWGLVLAVERRWRALGCIAAAGALALLLAGPQIHDLVVGRAGGGAPPIVLTVRAFQPLEAMLFGSAWLYPARLLALPLNYFAVFGALVSGSILFWRSRGEAAPAPEFSRVLALAALAGLGLGAFLKSTLFNNDLGWRVPLFPLLAGAVWTIAALARLQGTPSRPVWRCVPGLLTALLVVGWATNLYALVDLRAYPWLSNQQEIAFLSADPRTERALRVAYGWADRNLPPDAVLQHDPTRQRAFAFALYGHHPTAVGDMYGSLFGADPRAVDARIAALAPLFSDPLPAAQVMARARAGHVDDLVVTAADPIWSKRGAALMRATPVYASARVRIVPVAALATLPSPSHEAGMAAARL